MHVRTSVSLAALALVLVAPAHAQQQGSLSDFQLPPDPDESTAPPVEGPVDPDAPVQTTPRAVPTERPTPRPTPQPTARIPLELPPPEPAPRPQPTATQRDEPAARTPQPAGQEQVETTAPTADAATETAPANAATSFDSTPPAATTVPAAPAAASPDESGALVPWLAALVAALAAAGAGYWFLRRREELTPVPVVEPPLARREPKPGAAPQAPPPPPKPKPKPQPQPAFATKADGVSLAARPVRFSRSLMNATFAYRVVLENRSGERWEGLAIEADLVTAHGSAPIAEQLADPAAPLAPMQTVATLAAGETIEVEGDVRLPLQQVRAIRQGSATVYIPLLRLRLEAKGKAPVARTFLVGQLPDRQGGNLQPFRLDEMPQSYSAIGMRPLD
jgi:hypothetical protein